MACQTVQRPSLELIWQKDAIIGSSIPYDVILLNEGLDLTGSNGAFGASETERRGGKVPVGVTTLFI